MRMAVAKSGFFRSSAIGPRSPGRLAFGSSTVAPLGMRPTVGTPWLTVSAWPTAAVPETATSPCATACTLPSAPDIGVSTSVPPISDVASPIEETVMSMRWPRFMNGGRSAVTMTAATLRLRSASLRTLIPSRSSIDCIVCSVNGALRKVSPVPSSPKTRP